MSGLWTLFSTLFPLVLAIFKEWQARSSAAAAAQRQYVLTQAEFDNIVSTVLTRLRLQAAKDSAAAQTTETQVDQSLQEREKDS
jgi:hypothetical protein